MLILSEKSIQGVHIKMISGLVWLLIVALSQVELRTFREAGNLIYRIV